MKKPLYTIACLGLGLQLVTAGAFAGTKFDGKSPACAIPVFNWSTAPVKDRASANQRLLTRIAGSLEDTQTNWRPDAFNGSRNGDLVGRGMYFEADPFSSSGYGPILTIAYLKPSQPLQDVRSLGPLDDPAMLKIATPSILSNSPIILHSWIASYGIDDGLTVRVPKTAKAEQMPFDFSKTEVVIDTSKDTIKLWSDHAPARSSDSLGQALQKYTDRFSDLYKIWNDDQPQLTDKSLWTLIKTELGDDENLGVGDFSIDKRGAYWDPFDKCDDMTENELADAITKLSAAKLIAQDAKATSSCDLKAAMLAQYKRTAGYMNLASIYNYIQNYKRQLGIQLDTSNNREGGVSSFSATCGKSP